ncbi:hypothetical protein [Brevibacillus choshinensis]|uniref:Lipoprotein n=1 Tax=Brevibacillus choshinensis TaxID=54911 RepID=A0ABX7FMA4_BRECH|nr:hypothetical protein [Brevibacillus choshinensis]QRG66130.1 hypothetical protein JNE38_21605 [Brevibacillus choshinensis]
MRKGWTICLVTLLCTAMGGCNQMGVKQSAGSAFEEVSDHFTTQDAYEFHGRTKLLTENSANGNVVNFSGRKDKEAVYMNVKLSVPEENRVNNLSLLNRGDKLYAKQGSDSSWKDVGQTKHGFQQEMDNWDPAYAFQQMAEMKKKVLPLPDENPNDDVEGVRVTLDSAKLKSWLVTQMSEQASGSQIQSTSSAVYKPSVKLAMSLSDGAWKKSATGHKGPRIQSQSAPNVSEIVDQMDVNAEYTVFYNKTSKLPTTISMSIQSQYDLKGQRVREHSQVETYLTNYGKVKPLPNPEESPAGK